MAIKNTSSNKYSVRVTSSISKKDIHFGTYDNIEYAHSVEQFACSIISMSSTWYGRVEQIAESLKLEDVIIICDKLMNKYRSSIIIKYLPSIYKKIRGI